MDASAEATNAFRALAAPQRRYALYHLHQQEGPVDFDDLAAYVADHVHNSSIEDLTEEVLENTRIELYHSHLPILEEMGIIAGQGNPRPITLTDNAAALKPFLDVAADADLDTAPPIE